MVNLRLVAVTSLGLLALASAPVFAGTRDDVLEAMGKCAALTDDKARLSCYDAVAPRLRDALNTPPAALDHTPTEDEQKSWFGFNIGDIFGSSTAPAKQTTPQQFGADKIPAPPPPAVSATASTATTAAPAEPQEIDSITAGVTEYSFNPFGKFIVFLDNGQVWKETDSDPAHFRSGDSVTIERGLLGSYNLHINDSSKVFKVTRVK